MTVHQELEIQIGELEASRARTSAEAIGVQSQLAEVNARLQETLPHADFVRVKNQRRDLVVRLSEKQSEIATLKSKLAELRTTKEVTSEKAILPVSTVKALMGIRDRWHEFSMDSSNHQKAREVAWKCSQEVRSILKTYFAAE